MVSTKIGDVTKNTNIMYFRDKTCKFPVNIEDCKLELFIGEEVIFPKYECFEELLINLSKNIRMKTIMRTFLKKLRTHIKREINN